MATSTVVPAKTTACPAVALAWAIASTRVPPVRRELPVAGEDEQRVVDADAETDHGGQRRRVLGDVAEGCEQAEQAGADGQRRQREPDGEHRGGRRAQRDEQHDEGHEQADALVALRVLVREVGDRAADLDLEPTVGRRGGGAADGFEVLGRELVEAHGVVDGGVRRAAVLAQGPRPRSERIGDAADVIERADASDRRLDHRGGRRLVEPTGVGVEHDAARRAGQAGEAGFDQLDRPLRFGPGDVERVGRLTTPGAVGADDGDRDRQPHEHDPGGTAGGRGAESVEDRSHRHPSFGQAARLGAGVMTTTCAGPLAGPFAYAVRDRRPALVGGSQGPRDGVGDDAVHDRRRAVQCARDARGPGPRRPGHHAPRAQPGGAAGAAPAAEPHGVDRRAHRRPVRRSAAGAPAQRPAGAGVLSPAGARRRRGRAPPRDRGERLPPRRRCISGRRRALRGARRPGPSAGRRRPHRAVARRTRLRRGGPGPLAGRTTRRCGVPGLRGR